VLDVLRALTCHPTANELFPTVRDHMPTISLGTVYRNLEILVEDGQVIRLDQGGPEFRYDGNTIPHNHFRCEQCGRVHDVGLVVTALESLVGTTVGRHKVTGYSLVLHGICATCDR